MARSAFPLFVVGCLLVALALLGTLALPGCANIVPPLGGPKDSLPPVLVKATPQVGQTGFTSNRITLEFDEYINLDNLLQELIINPPPERIPDIAGRLKQVSIKIKDTLKPNTTYSFQFGNAIKDVNENNPFRNFTYVFSTGAYINTLTLGGTVLNAKTGLPDSTMLVILHTSPDDSAVAKEKPRYATRPNGKGQFKFEYLPAQNFYVFTLKDEGFKRYTSNQTPFGFLGNAVAAGSADSSLLLRFFVNEKEEPKKTPTLPERGKKLDDKPALRYQHTAGSQEQDILSPFSIKFETPLRSWDSTGLVLTDTLYTPLAGARFTLDTSHKILTLQYPLKPESRYVVLAPKQFATDTAGLTTARADTIKINTKSEEDYGSVKFSFAGIDTVGTPLLQFVQNDAVVKTLPIEQGKLQVKLFTPGEYTLRILYDTNGNGKWDTGDYWKKRQPERVDAISLKCNIRANWQNEFDITL